MSVIKSKRGESKMEFVHTASELLIYTMRKCVNFPKRYTFYISQYIIKLANEIYDLVIMANDIYPSNNTEFQIRKNYLIRAKGLCKCIVAKIDIAGKMFSLEPNVMEFWCELIDKEITLLNGVIKADKTRFNNVKVESSN